MIIYTFRTFPWIDKLSHPYILSKIKQDLRILNKRIIDEKPKMILGLAKSNFQHSVIETVAINKFNKGIISSEGIARYKLSNLSIEGLRTNNLPSTSFCNYAMYKISENIASSKLKQCKHYFVHINEDDLIKLKSYFSLNL